MQKIDDPKLAAEVEKLGKLKFEMSKLKNQLKILQASANELEDAVEPVLKQLSIADNRIFETETMTLEVQRFTYERESIQWKPVFKLAYSKVNSATKRILDDAEATYTKMAKVRSTMSISQNEIFSVKDLIIKVIAKTKQFVNKLVGRMKKNNDIIADANNDLKKVLRDLER